MNAMLEHVPDLPLATLNEATPAWVAPPFVGSGHHRDDDGQYHDLDDETPASQSRGSWLR
jgi:hypothetical protein